MAIKPSSRPLGKFRFQMQIDGFDVGHFQSIGGLSHEIEALEFQEGGVNSHLHKLPGQGRYPNLTLKVGYINTRLLEEWHHGFAKAPGQVGRKSGAIVLLGDDGQEVARWNFRGAWPVKWEGPELDATAEQILVESVEIAHQGISRQ